jgi:hypothetical protein
MVNALTAAVVMALLTASEASAAVQLTIRAGRVWLKADRATPAQILAEWARVGQIQIVNGEQVRGGPLSLTLEAVSELEALSIVLRSAGGFVTLDRPRLAGMAADNGSRFERVVIVPVPSAAPTTPPRAVDVARVPQPADPIPMVTPSGAQRVIGADGQPMPDDQEGAPPPRPARGSIPPGFSPPPDRPSAQPPAAGAPTAAPQMTPGAARPGVIVPPTPPKRPGD